VFVTGFSITVTKSLYPLLATRRAGDKYYVATEQKQQNSKKPLQSSWQCPKSKENTTV